MSDELTAVAGAGLGPLLALEMAELGLIAPRLIKTDAHASGRVGFSGGTEAMMRANLLLRTADRVLMKLGSFRAEDFAALEKGAARLPWAKHVAAGRPLNVHARSRGSKLYHEGGIAERVARAAERRASKDEGAAAVFVDIKEDVATVEVDTSGEPLHRRGWRLATAKAPLKETLAAALLVASRWDGRSTLLDPFCGSGTIAIEAALLAMRFPAGAARRFAFMEWPGFDAGLWERVKAGARGTPVTPFPKILASDRDAGAIEAARANAQRAGVGDRIEFSVKALSDVRAPSGPGHLITNPPYGVRVSEGKDLRALYASLGNVARGLGPEWTTTMLSADPALARATGLPFDAGLPTLNGGLKVRILTARPR